MIELFNEINSVLKFVDTSIYKIITEYAHIKKIKKIKLIKKYKTSKNSIVEVTGNKIVDISNTNKIKILNLSNKKIIYEFDIYIYLDLWP